MEEKKKDIDGCEIVDKNQLRMLNMGAEQTSSSDCDDCDGQPRRRNKVSSSMQRGIDRLLRSTLDDKKKAADGDSKGSFIDKDGKIKFDRRLYDLDVFKTILVKIVGFDYRKLKLKEDLIKKKDIQDDVTDVSEKLMMKPKKITSVLEYNDGLTDRELAHLESIFAKECRKCDTIKVPQSHHCSTCNACIARMDHHCPWVNNCVGYYN